MLQAARRTTVTHGVNRRRRDTAGYDESPRKPAPAPTEATKAAPLPPDRRRRQRRRCREIAVMGSAELERLGAHYGTAPVRSSDEPSPSTARRFWQRILGLVESAPP